MLRYLLVASFIFALATCSGTEIAGTVSPPSNNSTSPPNRSSARLFQNDPDSVTLVDVAAVFALFQNPTATPEQILDSVNTLTNSNLNQLSPIPSVTNANFVAPTGSIDILDVAYVFARFQNPSASDDTLVAIINTLTGASISRSDLLTESTSDFEIEVEFLNISDDGSVPATIQTLVNQAATRWQQLIIEDLPDAVVSLNPGECNIPINGSAISDRPVDDLLLLVRINSSIGGAATGGPCRNRGAGTTTVVGQVNLSPSLLTQSDTTIRDVVIHEIGHVLGMGAGNSSWIGGITGSGTSDPRQTTPNAVSQYQALGGPAASVPVQASVEGHWRGDVAGEVLDEELMTPVYRIGQPNPLSRITLGFLSDMSYGVDLSAADSFTVPDLTSNSRQHGIERSGTFLDLSNDYVPLSDNATDGVRLR